MGRKPDIGKYTRDRNRIKKLRARQRQQKLLECGMLSLTNVCNERTATTHEMEAYWKAVSIAVATSKVNEKPGEEFTKEEVHEDLSGSQSLLQVKLELETEEEMEKRLAEETYCVKIKNIKVKVEPTDENQ